jgi:hypothetical protein
MMRIQKNVFLLLGLCIVLFSLPHTSFAQAGAIDAAQGTYGQSTNCNNTTTNGFVPLACYSNSPQFSNIFNQTGLSGYVTAVFTTALSIGAILAVLRIAYGGYMYMGSADMWGNKQQAREIIGDAIIGLLLLFGIYLILYQLNPNLLNLNVLNDITPVSPAASSSATQGSIAVPSNTAPGSSI